MIDKKNWIEKQREEAEKVFQPKIYYDKEQDILRIVWFPHLDYDHSVETENGFVFDILEKPEQEVKGIEIFDFKEKMNGQKKNN